MSILRGGAMRYLEFIINNYRAIVGPLQVSLRKNTLVPVIGINESGKTTILHAIFSFDHFNDKLNGGQHLKDTRNLFRTSPVDPTIEAVIELHRADTSDLLKKFQNTDQIQAYLKKRRSWPVEWRIQRNLSTLKYSIVSPDFGLSLEMQNVVCLELMRSL